MPPVHPSALTSLALRSISLTFLFSSFLLFSSASSYISSDQKWQSNSEDFSPPPSGPSRRLFSACFISLNLLQTQHTLLTVEIFSGAIPSCDGGHMSLNGQPSNKQNQEKVQRVFELNHLCHILILFITYVAVEFAMNIF